MKRHRIAAETANIADRLDELEKETREKGHPVVALMLNDAARDLREAAWVLAKDGKR